MAGWLDQYKSLPIEFVLQEYLDRSYLKQCLDSDALIESTRTQLGELLDDLPEDGCNIVSYRRKKFGRWYPTSYGSTRMWRAIRAGALPSSYVDIDAVSCFPSGLIQLCKIHNIPNDEYSHIEMYTHNRKPYIDALQISDDFLERYCYITKDIVTKDQLGKLVYNMQCYGAGNSAWKEIGSINARGNGVNPFPKDRAASQFRKQWENLKTKFCKMSEYAEIMLEANDNKRRKGAPYHDGCGLSLLLQTFEALNVYRLMDVFRKYLRVYEYDGIIVEMPPSEVSTILDNLGPDISLKFTIKKRGSSLEMIEDQIIGQSPPDKRESKTKTIEWHTDADAAEQILRLYPKTFIVIGNDVYTRQGHLYKKSEITNSEPYIHTFISGLDMTCLEGKQEEKHRNTHGCRAITAALKDILLSDPKYHHNIVDICNKFTGMLCFSNGVLNLAGKKGQNWREYTDDDIVIQAIDHPYNGKFQDETMDKLKEIFTCLDEPYRSYLLHLLSRAFGGHYSDKFWCILTGNRNSGKGLVQEVCKLLGSYTSFINAPVVAGETDQARVLGTYMNAGGDLHGIAFSNEASNTTRSVTKIDGEIVKKLCSGGDQQQARLLHKDSCPFTFTKIMILCFNSVPTVEPADALQNCHVFNMPYIYDNDNPLLLQSPLRRPCDKTLKEWVRTTPDLLDAFVDLLSSHYHWGDKVKPNTSHVGIIDSNDKLAVFASRFKLDPEGLVPKGDVQSILQGLQGLSDNRVLGKWLKKTFNILPFKKNEQDENGARVTRSYYKGLMLNPEYEEEEEDDEQHRSI